MQSNIDEWLNKIIFKVHYSIYLNESAKRVTQRNYLAALHRQLHTLSRTNCDTSSIPFPNWCSRYGPLLRCCISIIFKDNLSKWTQLNLFFITHNLGWPLPFSKHEVCLQMFKTWKSPRQEKNIFEVKKYQYNVLYQRMCEWKHCSEVLHKESAESLGLRN